MVEFKWVDRDGNEYEGPCPGAEYIRTKDGLYFVDEGTEEQFGGGYVSLQVVKGPKPTRELFDAVNEDFQRSFYKTISEVSKRNRVIIFV